MVSGLRPVLRASRRVTSAGEPPALRQPLRRRIIMVRSVFAQLAELAAAAHPLRVPLDKTVHRAFQKTDSLAAVHHEPPADQAQPAPAGNGLGRHIEPLGQSLDRQYVLSRRSGRHVGGVGEVLDEQPQIMPRVTARQLEVGIFAGAIIGDPVTEIFVGVCPSGIDLAQQLLGLRDLLEFLLAGSKPHLLIAEFADGWIQVVCVHEKRLSSARRGGNSHWIPLPVAQIAPAVLGRPRANPAPLI